MTNSILYPSSIPTSSINPSNIPTSIPSIYPSSIPSLLPVPQPTSSPTKNNGIIHIEIFLFTVLGICGFLILLRPCKWFYIYKKYCIKTHPDSNTSNEIVEIQLTNITIEDIEDINNISKSTRFCMAGDYVNTNNYQNESTIYSNTINYT